MTPPDQTPLPSDQPKSSDQEPSFISSKEESQFNEHGQELLHVEQEFREPELTSDLDVGVVHEELNRQGQGVQPGFVPVPFSLLTLFGLVVLWAGVYLGTYSGGFKGNVFTEIPGSGGSKAVLPIDPRVLGEKLYNVNCAQCHQSTGLGQSGQFPPLAGSEWVVGPAPNRLPLILLHGIQGTIHVKGAVYNNQMPAWNTLKDAQIAAILTYIRSAWGNSASPITEQQMALARKETESHSEAYTEAELLKVPEGPLKGSEAGGSQTPVPGPNGPAAKGPGALGPKEPVPTNSQTTPK